MALKRTRCAILSVCVTLAIGGAAADDMPFWGEGSPATNRVAAVDGTRSVQRFSSFAHFGRSFALQKFNSQKPALVIVVR